MVRHLFFFPTPTTEQPLRRSSPVFESVVLPPTPSVSDSVRSASVSLCPTCAPSGRHRCAQHITVRISVYRLKSASDGHVGIFSRSCVDPELVRSVSSVPSRTLTNIIGASFGVTAVSVLTESH